MVSRIRAFAAIVCAVSALAAPSAQTDLDAFMGQVLARRDENWKKLQQYILDERESIELRGPNRLPMWGERREYTWFIRDGFFIRSPLKVNGVDVPDGERRKFEADYLMRQQAREWRAQRGEVGLSSSGINVQPPDDPVDTDPVRDIDGILKQSRQPQFISSAYFLRFKFEEGKYALVGHETIDSHDVLRVEYYPARLFSGSDRRRRDTASPTDKARDAEFRRLMNKVALVTLWIEPTAHQIVKYTFDNVALDFLPGRWLVHVDSARATMTMGQPIADMKEIWLPSGLEVTLGMSLASGPFDLRYALEYHDYRRPDVTSKLGVKEH